MILSHWLAGLSVAFVFWIVAFCTGFGLIVMSDLAVDRLDSKPIRCGVLVPTCVGFACIIFGLFLISAAHLLHAGAVVAVLAALPIVSLFAASRRLTFGVVLVRMRSVFSETAGPFWIAALAISTILSMPALLPPNVYDDTMYHLAYAIEWAHAGGLVVDQFLRFPLSQFNVEILYAAMFRVHLDAYVEFITWMFFAITATGIVEMASLLLRSMDCRPIASNIVGLIASCIFMFCPVVLRFADVAYVDIPAGAMLLGFTAAALRSRLKFASYGVAMALIGGSFIGMKLSFAPFILLIGGLIVWFGLKNRASRRRLFATTALFIVFAGPWFVRNLFVSGDPVDPILNVALHHPSYWNSIDLDAQRSELWYPEFPLAIPVRIFLDNAFSGDAVSISFLLLYLPPIVLLILLIRRKLRSLASAYSLVTGIVVVSIFAELLVTDRIARYALHFLAIYILFLVATFWIALRWIWNKKLPGRQVSLEVVFALVIAALAIPSPSGSSELAALRSQYDSIDLGVRRPNAFLAQTAGFQQADELARMFVAAGSSERVLTVNFQNLAYFFRRRNVISIGDWFGLARVADFQTAITTSKVGDYLQRFQIGAVLFPRTPGPLTQRQIDALEVQLRQAGFSEMTWSSGQAIEFVKTDIMTAAAQHGVVGESQMENSVGSIDFQDHFKLGVIDHDSTIHLQKGGLTVFVFQVPFGEYAINSLTVISGCSISFKHLSVAPDSVLSFNVAKVGAVGTPAISWVDVVSGGARKRVFSRITDPATQDGPLWQQVRIPINVARNDVSVIFGAASTPTGGIGDWIGYANPRLSHASFTGR